MEPDYATYGLLDPWPRRPQRGAVTKKRRNTARSQTCPRCRANKSKCDGRLPCSRCFDNAFSCGPPHADDEASGSAGGHGKGSRAAGGGDGSGGGDEGGALDIVPMVYLRAEYTPILQAFLSSFDHLHRADILDRGRILRIISQWRASSARVGWDVSRSLTAALERRLGRATGATLWMQEQEGAAVGGESDEGENSGPQAGASKRRLSASESAERAALLSASDVLLSSTLVRRHDDCLTPTLFFGLPPEEGQAAPGPVLSGWGHLLHPATNDLFGAVFQSGSELIDASIRYHMPPFLLLGMLCAPDDRRTFFGSVVHTLFGKESGPGCSDFIKMATRTGDIHVYLLKAARLRLDENVPLGRPLELREAVALTFVQTPPSRHLTERPHIAVSRRQRYRKGGVDVMGQEEKMQAQVQVHEYASMSVPLRAGPEGELPPASRALSTSVDVPLLPPPIAALPLGGAVMVDEGVWLRLLEAAPSMSGIFAPAARPDPRVFKEGGERSQQGEAKEHQEHEQEAGGLQERVSSTSAASSSSSSSISMVSRVINAVVVLPHSPAPTPMAMATQAPALRVDPAAAMPLDDAAVMERLTPSLYRFGGAALFSGSSNRSPAGGGFGLRLIAQGAAGGSRVAGQGDEEDEDEEGEGDGAGDVENRSAFHGRRGPRGVPRVPVLRSRAMEGVFSDSEEEEEGWARGTRATG